MRELTVRLRFTKPCLGNVQDRRRRDGRFLLPRGPQGAVTFMAAWHRANLRFAAALVGLDAAEVGRVHWDIAVDGVVRPDGWFRRFRPGSKRYTLHEAFLPGQVVGVNCVVPASLSDEDFWRLLSLAGRYRGLSPYGPGEYGLFEVISVRPRRPPGGPAAAGEEGEGQTTGPRSAAN